MVKPVIFIVCFLSCCKPVIAQDTTQQVIAGRTNSRAQQKKPYVILISADGFRYDFADKYQATNLLHLSNQGVKAAYMQPSFPSLTYPNHYTIVTGLYPSHHGLVDNSFYDRNRKAVYSMSNKKIVADGSWYGGTPLWVLAEKQQMLSACFYWVASESNIQGTKPSYYYHYNEKIPVDRRLAILKEWLLLPGTKRPHFISFYFPEVDYAAHVYGPDSKEAGEAVRLVDESIGKMNRMVASLQLDVNFIFLSDHGMTRVDNEHTISLPASIDTNKVIVSQGDALLQLYVKNKNEIKALYQSLEKEAKDFDVYLDTEMPAQLHYSKKDDRFNRIGDIILIPRVPKIFGLSNRVINKGKHGYDPAITDMRASFFAWGPAFKQKMQIDGFENVHVYPLIVEILGLSYNKSSVDGDIKVLKNVLK